MRRLALLTILLITLLIPAPVDAQATVTSIASGNWSAPGTWSGGTIPTTGTSVTIAQGHIVTANVVSATVGSLTVNGELRYLASQSVTLQSTGNVVVNGKLTMKPSSATVVHTLRFINVNEANYVGGGMDPIASDVGLWDMGLLDIAGTTKTAWTRAAGSIAQGATQITLIAVPVGWRVGDEISIVPSEPTTVGIASWNGFDLRTITAISGATVTLNAPTTRAHPIATNPFNGSIYPAEVLNLTRNVRIEGTGNGLAAPTGNGRAHIFIRSTQAQSIKYLAVRYMGPRQVSGNYTASVLGRYGLHFHMDGDGSRGSLVEGVVVRDTGGHAFVPHASHGITLKDTIAYNVFDDAYWWDAPATQADTANDTNDLLIDHAVAALVQYDPPFGGYRVTGFLLRKGTGLTLRNSVAVGVQGSVDASGYSWPELGHAVWSFTNDVAHNNKTDGIFAWQNNLLAHEVISYTAYYNGEYGIDHGAYGNSYHYADVDLWANKLGDLNSRASSRNIRRPDGYGQAFERVRMLGIFVIAEHNSVYQAPTLVKDCIIGGIKVNETPKPVAGQYDFVNCTKPNGASIEVSDFTFVFARPESVYRVQRADGTAYLLAGTGEVSEIAPFYGTQGVPAP